MYSVAIMPEIVHNEMSGVLDNTGTVAYAGELYANISNHALGCVTPEHLLTSESPHGSTVQDDISPSSLIMHTSQTHATVATDTLNGIKLQEGSNDSSEPDVQGDMLTPDATLSTIQSQASLIDVQLSVRSSINLNDWSDYNKYADLLSSVLGVVIIEDYWTVNGNGLMRMVLDQMYEDPDKHVNEFKEDIYMYMDKERPRLQSIIKDMITSKTYLYASLQHSFLDGSETCIDGALTVISEYLNVNICVMLPHRIWTTRPVDTWDDLRQCSLYFCVSDNKLYQVLRSEHLANMCKQLTTANDEILPHDAICPASDNNFRWMLDIEKDKCIAIDARKPLARCHFSGSQKFLDQLQGPLGVTALQTPVSDSISEEIIRQLDLPDWYDTGTLLDHLRKFYNCLPDEDSRWQLIKGQRNLTVRTLRRHVQNGSMKPLDMFLIAVAIMFNTSMAIIMPHSIWCSEEIPDWRLDMLLQCSVFLYAHRGHLYGMDKEVNGPNVTITFEPAADGTDMELYLRSVSNMRTDAGLSDTEMTNKSRKPAVVIHEEVFTSAQDYLNHVTTKLQKRLQRDRQAKADFQQMGVRSSGKSAACTVSSQPTTDAYAGVSADDDVIKSTENNLASEDTLHGCIPSQEATFTQETNGDDVGKKRVLGGVKTLTNTHEDKLLLDHHAQESRKNTSRKPKKRLSKRVKAGQIRRHYRSLLRSYRYKLRSSCQSVRLSVDLDTSGSFSGKSDNDITSEDESSAVQLCLLDHLGINKVSGTVGISPKKSSSRKRTSSENQKPSPIKIRRDYTPHTKIELKVQKPDKWILIPEQNLFVFQDKEPIVRKHDRYDFRIKRSKKGCHFVKALPSTQTNQPNSGSNSKLLDIEKGGALKKAVCGKDSSTLRKSASARNGSPQRKKMKLELEQTAENIDVLQTRACSYVKRAGQIPKSCPDVNQHSFDTKEARVKKIVDNKRSEDVQGEDRHVPETRSNGHIAHCDINLINGSKESDKDHKVASDSNNGEPAKNQGMDIRANGHSETDILHDTEVNKASIEEIRDQEEDRKHSGETGKNSNLPRKTQDSQQEDTHNEEQASVDREESQEEHVRDVKSTMRHGKKIFECEECDRAFSHQKTLNSHVKEVHRREIRFTCETCKRGFFKMGPFKAHVLRHENKREYSCTTCSRTFTLIGDKNYHEKTCGKSQDEKYYCAEHNKFFKTMETYRQHLRNHIAAGVKTPYQCQVCTTIRTFSHYQGIYNHYRSFHQGEMDQVKDLPRYCQEF